MKSRGNKNKKDPKKATVPAAPPTQGPGRSQINTSFFFTQYVMDGRSKDTSREMDPREALLKMDTMSKTDPIFLGSAYKNTQPVNIMHESSFEAEQEEFKKKQRLI